ncbi:MAG: winged helix-turn-helix domain-containing protein [Nanoarchaeota archaeon]|nr:winged helix-turn-helix domain-containing protein [Nanoarchaeota archaeon]
MNKKRTKLEVIRDILNTIKSKNGKIKPTHILYKSNLSYQMMDEYLTELKGKGFIIDNGKQKGRTYTVTEKGFKFLEQYNLIVDFTSSFGL